MRRQYHPPHPCLVTIILILSICLSSTLAQTSTNFLLSSSSSPSNSILQIPTSINRQFGLELQVDVDVVVDEDHGQEGGGN